MADQTVEQKLEELHKMQVEMLQRQIAEQRNQHDLALEREREANQEQRKAAGEYARERVQELMKQNDGMLGAIGRLHGENETLRKQLQEAENKAKERQDLIERNEKLVCMEMERVRTELMEREKKAKEEMYKVTQENLELRRRLGEKVPKSRTMNDIVGAFGKEKKAKKK